MNELKNLSGVKIVPEVIELLLTSANTILMKMNRHVAGITKLQFFEYDIEKNG